MLVTPTLGANRGALERFGLEGHLEEYNRRLTALTRQAAGGPALVAGDLGPTGQAIPPYGETPFEALVDLYAEQAGVLLSAGVDLFLVESVMAMAEARAAVLGIRKAGGDKPVLVTCYCDDEGRTPTGTDVWPVPRVQGMGVAAFGLNCVDPAVAEEQLPVSTSIRICPSLPSPRRRPAETLSDGTPAYQDNAGNSPKGSPSWAAAGCAASSAAVAAPTRAISGRCGKRWSRSIFPRFHRWRRTRT